MTAMAFNHERCKLMKSIGFNSWGMIELVRSTRRGLPQNEVESCNSSDRDEITLKPIPLHLICSQSESHLVASWSPVVLFCATGSRSNRRDEPSGPHYLKLMSSQSNIHISILLQSLERSKIRWKIGNHRRSVVKKSEVRPLRMCTNWGRYKPCGGRRGENAE